MAFPIILVDSTNGAASDTACSGAGPTTALTGTAGATDGAGTTVTLDSGTVLTGVATDGSHALYFADTTVGHRRFTKITGTAGSGGATPTVTVNEALTISLSGKSWAIGGVRATVGGAVSALLINNNSASGDAMPGWAIEMQSGHSETLSATLSFFRSGDTTSGRIQLRGKSGAATLPLLTFSNNDKALDTLAATGWIIRDFELQNTNATKTASIAIKVDNGAATRETTLVSGMKIAHSTNKFWRGIYMTVDTVIMACEVGYCASVGIDGADTSFGDTVGSAAVYNYVHDCGSHGISINQVGNGSGLLIQGNIFANNGGDGVHAINCSGLQLIANTCHNNTSSGAFLTPGSGILLALNNIFSNNGAYGINFNGATAGGLAYFTVDRNDTFTNTSGAYSTSGVATNDPGLDPQYTNAAGGDYSIGTNLKAQGYPLGGTLHVGTTSSTYSYVDIGAAQRQEAGGSAGMLYVPNLDGV